MKEEVLTWSANSLGLFNLLRYNEQFGAAMTAMYDVRVLIARREHAKSSRTNSWGNRHRSRYHILV